MHLPMYIAIGDISQLACQVSTCLQPSDRLGGTWTEAAPDEREAVGRVLTEVFGRIDKVEL